MTEVFRLLTAHLCRQYNIGIADRHHADACVFAEADANGRCAARIEDPVAQMEQVLTRRTFPRPNQFSFLYCHIYLLSRTGAEDVSSQNDTTQFIG